MMDQNLIIERLKFHEGFKLTPYKDTRGRLTIGIGRCIDTNPFSQQELNFLGDWQHGITPCAAYQLCRNDINKCKTDLNTLGVWYHNLDDERKYALLDMCFQMGFQNLKEFKNMIKHLQNKDWQGAYYECLNSDYAKQTPTRAKRIAILLKTGRWYKYINDYEKKGAQNDNLSRR